MIAHECGHQAFSKWQPVNDGVGLVLHSCLLVPYFSWCELRSFASSMRLCIITGQDVTQIAKCIKCVQEALTPAAPLEYSKPGEG